MLIMQCPLYGLTFGLMADYGQETSEHDTVWHRYHPRIALADKPRSPQLCLREDLPCVCASSSKRNIAMRVCLWPWRTNCDNGDTTSICWNRMPRSPLCSILSRKATMPMS